MIEYSNKIGNPPLLISVPKINFGPMFAHVPATQPQVAETGKDTALEDQPRVTQEGKTNVTIENTSRLQADSSSGPRNIAASTKTQLEETQKEKPAEKGGLVKSGS